VVLSLILLGLIAASAYGLSRYVRFRANQHIVEQQLTEQIQGMLEQCRKQILRHPDYDLQSERLYLSSFTQMPVKDQLRRHGELKDFSVELAKKLLERSAGIKPGEERWSEVMRYKTYSPNGFKELLDQIIYPHTQPIDQAPPISGDPRADERIVELAMARGYRLRCQADENALVTVGRNTLQEPVWTAWRNMQAAALEEGIRLELVSAYRSVDRQRQIFLRELGNLSRQHRKGDFTTEEIAAGEADALIEEVLRYSSLPGFSKHHSGYTIDISDPSSGVAFTDFAQTQGFLWISSQNYLNAKRFGFIPSYPEGAVGQGPEPEPWEYVWVGLEILQTSGGE
jgi:D-alanyl-D-alanine carboxypeptidase